MQRTPTDASSLTIADVHLGKSPTRKAGLRRLRQEWRYGSALAERIQAFRPEIVLSANAPLGVQRAALKAAHLAGGRFVFWMQDVHSVAIRNVVRRRSRLVGSVAAVWFGRLERELATNSDAVVAISPTFLSVLDSWHLDASRIQIIPNWAPIPIDTPSGGRWRQEHGLIAESPVVLYAGTLGRKHDPMVLLHLARSMPNVQVVVAAEGTGADWLMEHRGDMPNLRVLPIQPAESLDDMLDSSDVLLALLEADAGDFSVPSKVLTYLAAGKPIVASIPPSNPAATVIAEANGGIVVDPGDATALIAAVRTLLADRELANRASSSGGAYARHAFAIGPIADRFQAVFEGLRRHTANPSHNSTTEARL